MTDEMPSSEELRAAMYENVSKGYAEVCGETDDGQPIFRMTEAGKRYVREQLLYPPREEGIIE